jgi:hypothetical protein
LIQIKISGVLVNTVRRGGQLRMVTCPREDKIGNGKPGHPRIKPIQ